MRAFPIGNVPVLDVHILILEISSLFQFRNLGQPPAMTLRSAEARREKGSNKLPRERAADDQPAQTNDI